MVKLNDTDCRSELITIMNHLNHMTAEEPSSRFPSGGAAAVANICNARTTNLHPSCGENTPSSQSRGASFHPVCKRTKTSPLLAAYKESIIPNLTYTLPVFSLVFVTLTFYLILRHLSSLFSSSTQHLSSTLPFEVTPSR